MDKFLLHYIIIVIMGGRGDIQIRESCGGKGSKVSDSGIDLIPKWEYLHTHTQINTHTHTVTHTYVHRKLIFTANTQTLTPNEMIDN